MNVENLKKLIAFIPSIPDDKLDMSMYRKDKKLTHICNTVGCIVGWSSAILSEEEYKFYTEKLEKDLSNINLDYQDFAFLWSTNFFNLDVGQWDYLFGSHHKNSKTLAIGRIEKLIANKGVLPEDYENHLPF